MDKSESSDSDSNSSTSWVFVEPIQELTEQDLLSAGSDFESDTDGVSVISESEAVHEELNEDTCEETSDLLNANIDSCETLTGHPEILNKPLVNESKKLFKNPNIVGVGVVLTAVFLGSYTFIVQRNSIDNTGDLQDFIVYDNAKIDTNLLCTPETSIDNKLEEIVDLTIACTYKDQDKVVVKNKEIKQCVKVQYDTKKSEKETQMFDSLGKAQDEAQTINRRIIAEEADETSINIVEIDYLQQDNKKQELLYVYEATDEHKEEPKVNLDFAPKNNKTRRYTKDKNDEKRSKDKYKHKKDDKKSFDNKKHFQKFEKSLHKYEIRAKNPKTVYKNKFENPKRSYEVKFKQNKHFVNEKKNSTSKDFKEEGRSEEWYNNWHKARQQLRKHDLIDAQHPYKKKMKMQWYFKWMDGREELRYKKSYRPYSS